MRRPLGFSAVVTPAGATARSGLAAPLGGAALAAAWLVPETVACALLGWVAAILMAFAVRARRAYLPAYCAGLVGHALGFYWVYGTVSAFGGFGAVPSALIFALFVSLGALQFLLFAVLHHNLGPLHDALALRAPTAWVLSELVSFRLFKWHLGHTQLAFTPFVQAAGLGGAMLVSFLMFWVAEVIVRAVAFGEVRRAFLLPAAAFLGSLAYGAATVRTFDAPAARTQDVVLVQGDAALAARRDVGSARENLARLYALSRRAEIRDALIVWPEGAIPAYIPADLGPAGGRDGASLPRFGDGSALLVGAYAFDQQLRRYNAAFAVHPDGVVPRPYFKRILIPFGERMPLASLVPRLKRLNARAGAFTAGRQARVFEYPMRRADGAAYALKVAPLICYEDTVPALSREAARGGAELLVNLTSDSWFGRSAALHQHHVIAAFRAIENRRFLVRSTTTGLSAVVDPLGRTIARIPAFSEGTVKVRVGLLGGESAYTGLVGDRPWWALLAASLAAMALDGWRGAMRRHGCPSRSSAPGPSASRSSRESASPVR
jgi:apolipoprotein N-acyltransferase